MDNSKMRSLTRRLSASKPLFVVPTDLRHLPRLRPHPRLDLCPRRRRARYGFPSPIAFFRSRPAITHAKFAVQPLSDRAPSGVACHPRTLFGIFFALVSFLISIFVRAVRARPPSSRCRNYRHPRCHQHPINHPQLPLRRRHSTGKFPRHLCTACSHLGSITTAALSLCLSTLPAQD